MRRLYLRLYVAVLLSLIVFAIIAGLVFRLGGEAYGPRHMAPDVAGELIAELLPQAGGGEAGKAAEAGKASEAGKGPEAAGSNEAVQQTLERWHRRAHVDITLYDASGRILAAVGPPLEPPDPGQHGWSAPGRGPPAFVADLPDGKRMVLRRMRPPGPPPMRLPGFFVMLALIALGVAVGAYPVVRKLTGRIERLQRSVEALGAGDLATRVKVEGRDEVAALATSFNHSAGRIEALVSSQKDLLANASHELRSPLARIRMAIELLSPQASDTVRQELNRDITELDQLIDEILLASRLDATTVGTRLIGEEDAEVDLMALCAEECARVGLELNVRASGDETGVSTSPLDLDGALIDGDARLLRRMIRNLIENALRYGQGKPVEVRLTLATPLTSSTQAAGPRAEVIDQGPV